jgi:hypothetical protein
MELYGKNSTSTCNLEELGGVFSKPLCEMINIIYYFLQHYYLQHYHSIGYYFFVSILLLLHHHSSSDETVEEQPVLAPLGLGPT